VDDGCPAVPVLLPAAGAAGLELSLQEINTKLVKHTTTISIIGATDLLNIIIPSLRMLVEKILIKNRNKPCSSHVTGTLRTRVPDNG
jgi:hypothetical protein